MPIQIVPLLLIAMFLTNAGQGQEADSIVELSLPVEKNTLSVENPDGLTLKLAIFHQGKKRSLAGITSSQSRVTYRLPTGMYFVESTNMKFAAPVLNSRILKNGLVICVRKIHGPTTDKNWALIPAGPTVVGDTLGVGARDESPLRVIQLPAFWLGKCEVTNQQFAEFLNAQEKFDEKWIDLGSRKCLIEKLKAGKNGEVAYQVNTSKYKNAARYPVVMVSKYGAEAYCNWLSEKSGTKHRLPTEMEWEKAARGPFSTVYSYGDRYDSGAANQESGYLKPVGTYRPNPYGLYDMTGNVFEWMSNKYRESQQTNMMNHALRGGSFVLDGMYLRNSFRMRQSPSVMTDDIGFRVLREIDTKETRETTINQKESK